MNRPSLNPDLLRKYLSGHCTEEEKQQVEAWYDQLDKGKASGQRFLFDEQALNNRIWESISQHEPVAEPVLRPLWQRPWLRWSSVAAVVLLVLGIAFWGQPALQQTTMPSPVASALITITNQDRSIFRQPLPDGSVVWLNPGAKLTFPRQFAAATRQVQFSGEGFFEVAKDTAHPFAIQSGRMRTQVLGTSFNVKAYADSKTYEVSVVTGKVAVSAPDQAGQLKTVILQPQQQAVLALETNQLTANDVPIKSARAELWQSVSLSFDEVPLSEVGRQLEKAFDVRIVLANPKLANCRLKVDFTQQRLPEILAMINQLIDTEYEITGQRITLTGEGCDR